jgi:hypothetical protein
MKKEKIIYVEVPKEIYDAHMSIWSSLLNRDVFGAWMKSIRDVMNQMNK